MDRYQMHQQSLYDPVVISDALVKRNKKLKQQATPDVLNELWQKFDKNDVKCKESQIQMRTSHEFGSKWVLRSTPNIEKYYKILNQVGQPGQFGVCYKAKNIITNEIYGIKFIEKNRVNMSKSIKKTFFGDIRIEAFLLWKVCDHPNIVSYHKIFENEKYLMIVMDFCDLGELFDKIAKNKRIKEDNTAYYLRQMCSALYYIHSLNVVHCDLKPENFLLKTDNDGNERVILIDFGVSKQFKFGKYFQDITGSPSYIAPEVLDGNFNEACDMWSMGIITFVMIFGYLPFDTNIKNDINFDKLFTKIKKGFKPKVKPGYGAYFPEKIPVSDICKDFISKLLRLKVESRLTADEALEHPFIANIAKKNSQRIKLAIPAILKIFRQENIIHKKHTEFQLEIVSMLQKSNFLHKFQIDRMKEFINILDKNNIGLITKEQLLDGIKMVDNNININDINDGFDIIDMDNDGKISLDDLIKARIICKLTANEGRLKMIFNSLDRDKNGLIDVNEFTQAILAFNNNMDINKSKIKNNAINLIKEVSNGDEYIDFNQFLSQFTQLKLL